MLTWTCLRLLLLCIIIQPANRCVPEVWWSQLSWQSEDPSQSSPQLWVLCPNSGWHWRMTSREQLWLHFFPIQKQVLLCHSYLLLHFISYFVTEPTESFLAEDPICHCWICQNKDNIYSFQHSASDWRESMVGVISSLWAEANKWWENILQIFRMLLQNYQRHYEDEDTEAETHLCCTTWTWVYMAARLDTFLTPCWVTYWELRR